MRKNFQVTLYIPLDCVELSHRKRNQELITDLLIKYMLENNIIYDYHLFSDDTLIMTSVLDNVYDKMNEMVINKKAKAFYKIISTRNKNYYVVYDKKGKLIVFKKNKN